MARVRSASRRRWWRASAQFGVTAACLVVLVVRIGGGPFARGLDSLTVPVIVAAVGLTALSTACAAWRWRIVARQLDAPLPRSRAVAAYYRSQFLNSVLPGGVLGDADRAIAHGRDLDDVGRAARAVLWDRTTGQIVQAVVAIAVLGIVPSPGRRLVLVLALFVGCAVIVAWRACRSQRSGQSWRDRMVGAVRRDLRAVGKWPASTVLVTASLGVIVSHVALFVIVARSVEPSASAGTLIPLAVIVLIATGIPLSVAGWGLREGASAWAFAAAGLGAATGVAASTAYGVASLIAVLPGVVVLATDSLRRHGAAEPAPVRSGSPARRAGVVHG